MVDIEKQRREWRREFEDIGPAGVERNLRELKQGWWGKKGDEANRWLREKNSEAATERLRELREEAQLEVGRSQLWWMKWTLALVVLIAIVGWLSCPTAAVTP